MAWYTLIVGLYMITTYNNAKLHIYELHIYIFKNNTIYSHVRYTAVLKYNTIYNGFE